MATLNREFLIYIDGAKWGGLDATLDGTSSAPPSLPHCFMAGDRATLKLFFRARDAANGPSTADTLPAGSTIVVAGRVAASDGALLFVASSFSASGDAYAGTVDLNTDAVATVMTSVAYGTYLDIYLDIEVRDAGDTVRTTYRINARLYKQVYAGEIAPSVVVPPAAILESPSGYRWQLAVTDDGQLQMTRVL
jgi:hypothetical protein